MPVLLGERHTPVVSGTAQRVKLKLIHSEHSAVGVVSLKYELDNSAISNIEAAQPAAEKRGG